MTIRTRYEVTCDGPDVAYSLAMENRREILKACKYDERHDRSDWTAVSAEGAKKAAAKADWTARKIGDDHADLCPSCTQYLAGVA